MDTLIGICEEFKVKYGHISLDLGCGNYCIPEHIGIDNLIGVDIQVDGMSPPAFIHDLNLPIPLPNESVDAVFTSHFLEHSRLDFIIPEVARILKPRGKFINRMPYASSAEGHYPGHNLFLTEKWFHESPLFNRHFSIEGVDFVPSDEYSALSEDIKQKFNFEFARTFFWQACKEFTLYSTKRVDG
jgi:SAM-dependent methyltransferase